MNRKVEFFCKQIDTPVFFVTPDVNWALGLEDYLVNYHVICYEGQPEADLLPEKVKLFCLQREFSQLKCPKNTGAMLNFKEVQRYIDSESKESKPAVMYFKPAPMIDKICEEKGYLQIGNSAGLARKWEDKLELVKLGEKYPELRVVPSEILSLSDVSWEGLFEVVNGHPLQLPLMKGENTLFVIQTARGWAGKCTYLVSNKEEFESLKKDLKGRQVKVAPFVEGKTYLNNACVVGDKVLQSPPAVQINCPDGGFSSLPMATCGRQWSGLKLSDDQVRKIESITEKVGMLMAKDGYKGYFGLDFIVSDESGEVFLQEINARLTASASFYTKLEIESGRVPLLFCHVMSFVDVKAKLSMESLALDRSLIGLQLILRNNDSKPVEVKDELQIGVYRLVGEDFEFVRSAYEVSEVDDRDEFLIVGPRQGAEVSPESELLRCESRFAVLENSRIPDGLKKGLLKLKENLV